MERLSGDHEAVAALFERRRPAPVTAPTSPTPEAGRVESRAMASTALRPRLDAVDFLRGLVIVVMVLDHARDFFGPAGFNPRDVHEPALFLTRWITHFCAPVFILLAGMSAFLYGNRGRTTRELSFFLLTRGLFLIAMELTLVRVAWTFSLRFEFLVFQVIWAIGVSMVVLSALVYLERWAVAAFGLVLVLGHNLLDPIKAEQFGASAWLWNVLHERGVLHPAEGVSAFVLYPLIPWIGVMALGYAFAPVLLLEERVRRRRLLAAGVLITAGFVALRASNLYGDPAAWKMQDGVLATVLSFINCEKYPPSLLYLAMTLGPALIVLSLFRQARNTLTRAVVTIGRVPFLLYVAHLFALHAIAVLLVLATTGDARWLFQGMALMHKPANYGLSLPIIYALWLAVVIGLYPLCRGFAALKQRRNDWWLSYL